MEKERILSEQENFHMNALKSKVIFQGEFAAQTRSSEARAQLDRREWERRNADIALLSVKLACSSNPRGWNSIRQFNCLIRRKGDELAK